MEGLCKMMDADAWAWALSTQRDPDKPQVYVALMHGGFTDETFVKLLQAVEHPEMIAVTNAYFRELHEQNTHLTHSRFEITTPEQLKSTGVEDAWKAADIGATLLSLHPIDEKASSAVAIYRRYGRPEFSARETRIAHIVLAEMPWLHRQGWPEDRGVKVPELSKRLRLALNLLILGHNQKQIADQMKISLHTVRGYVKETYRIFGVHSQAELMNRFHQGNGQDGK